MLRFLIFEAMLLIPQEQSISTPNATWSVFLTSQSPLHEHYGRSMITNPMSVTSRALFRNNRRKGSAAISVRV